MLTDLEYRVWTQYMLSADDCGVLRLSGLTIQADNDALAKRPMKMIEKALSALVTIGLIIDFDHQGRRYGCDPLWQDFQKVTHPRLSHAPMPPVDVVLQCSLETQGLFAYRAEKFSKLSKRSFGEHATDQRLTANGNGQEANGNVVNAQFERFWVVYPRKVGKDAARREFHRLAPDNDLIDRMLAAIEQQRASAQWLKDGGQFIPHPRTWLHQGRWADELPALVREGQASQIGKREIVAPDVPL